MGQRWGKRGLTLDNSCIYINAVGRPFLPENLRKNKNLLVRFTQSELDDLRKISKKHGIPISRMIREGLGMFHKNLESGEAKLQPKGENHEESS